MSRRLRILVIHNVENLRVARRSTMDHILCFERYAPDHDYVYHRIQLPVTAALRETDWDAVIFESTALGVVTIRPRELFFQLREEWAFLRNSKAVKIAFPQDDASHSALYDGWLSWMRVNVVFCVRPEKIDRLYPLSRETAEFRSTVAGYIDDHSVDSLRRLAKPWDERSKYLGQRVTRYPAWGGRFAQRKSDIVLRLDEECARRSLPTDVSTNPGEVLHGDAWYAFLGDCKFVAGAEGGHGLCDPYGAVQDQVNDYVARHPGASFDEIETACFEGLDGKELFPGFAPRILEAALMGCGQVLLEGRYRDFITPDIHYISVNEDYSNLAEVFECMANGERVGGMIARCVKDLVDSPTFRYSKLVRDVIDLIESRTRATGAEPFDKAALYARHVAQMRDALAVKGIERERLYEPYLTEWVNRELSGQMRDAGEAALHGLALPGMTTGAAIAPDVQEAALAHVCTVLRSLPRKPGVLPRVVEASVAQEESSGLTREQQFDEAYLALKTLGLAKDDLYALAVTAALPDGHDAGGTSLVDLHWATLRLARAVNGEGVEVALARRLLQLARCEVDELGADMDLASQKTDDVSGIARRSSWSADVVALLRAAGLDKDGPLAKGDRRIAAVLFHCAGFSADEFAALALLAEVDPSDCADVAVRLGWSGDVLALLHAARLERGGAIAKRDPDIAAALLDLVGFDPQDFGRLAQIAGVDPQRFGEVASRLGWPADVVAFLREGQASGPGKAALSLLARAARRRLGI